MCGIGGGEAGFVACQRLRGELRRAANGARRQACCVRRDDPGTTCEWTNGSPHAVQRLALRAWLDHSAGTAYEVWQRDYDIDTNRRNGGFSAY